jgi:hypothetical protein
MFGLVIHELRIYEIYEHNQQAFLDRFRDHAARIMERYEFDIRAMWVERGGDRPRFVYLLAWPDDDAMRSSWEAFLADEEWRQIKRDTTAAHGDLVGEIDEMILVPTDFSPSI